MNFIHIYDIFLHSKFTGGKGTGSNSNTDEEKDDKLNIFSLASGHLYERFLRIMIVSVMKNTKSKVKFWFLKNYLSPSVKVIIAVENKLKLLFDKQINLFSGIYSIYGGKIWI